MRAFGISSFVLPAPTLIAIRSISNQSQLLRHSFHTAWMTLAGIRACGGVWPVCSAWRSAPRGSCMRGPIRCWWASTPFPRSPLVPILVIWFGVGWLPPVLTAFLILVLSHRGERSPPASPRFEPETEDVLARARRLQARHHRQGRDSALRCRISSARFKVAITLAYVGSVIAEYNASNVGVGNLMARASADFKRTAPVGCADRPRGARRDHVCRHRPRREAHDRLGPALAIRGAVKRFRTPFAICASASVIASGVPTCSHVPSRRRP